MHVFLSYRRGDAAGHAGRLTDSLLRHLGSDHVFHDVTAIRPGEDFTAAIDRALDGCDVLLAVIGPGWLAVADTQGRRRLDDPGDYVRQELARALHRGIPVVPVLVSGARLPATADLPADLQGLVRRQAVTLRDETWHADVEHLVESLRGEPMTPGRPGRRRFVPIAAAAVVLAMAGGTVWLLTGDRDAAVGRTPHTPGNPASVTATGSPPPRCEPDDANWAPLDLAAARTATVPAGDGTLTFTVAEGRWREPEPDSVWEVELVVTMTNGTATGKEHGFWFYDYLAVSRRENRPKCFTADDFPMVRPSLAGDATIRFYVTCEPTGPIRLGLRPDRVVDVTGPAADTC